MGNFFLPIYDPLAYVNLFPIFGELRYDDLYLTLILFAIFIQLLYLAVKC